MTLYVWHTSVIQAQDARTACLVHDHFTHTRTLIHVVKLTTLIFASYNSCKVNHILDGLLYILDLQVFVHTHHDRRLLPDGELCGHVLLLAGCQCGLYTCSLLAVLIPCSILSPDELVPVSCHYVCLCPHYWKKDTLHFCPILHLTCTNLHNELCQCVKPSSNLNQSKIAC